MNDRDTDHQYFVDTEENNLVAAGGQRLRELRERLGFTVREVQAATEQVAAKYGNRAFAINKARLSDLEAKGILPNIYKLYALAAVYGKDLTDLLRFYGLNLDNLAQDAAEFHRPKTGFFGRFRPAAVRMPVQLDPGFDPRQTTNFGRLIAKWGMVSAAFLATFEGSHYTFGYIGTEDRSMYPLLLPGSFVQVDESRRRVIERPWASEYERPIYFVETREGHACSWCSIEGIHLVLHPHPMSADRVRIFRNGSEAEVVGQVVAFAMRLDQFEASRCRPASLAETKSIANV